MTPAFPIPLSLRVVPMARQLATAWFISGNKPAAWLRDVSSWGTPLSHVRFMVIPRSIQDRAAAGVLVSTDGVFRRMPATAVPYRLIAERIYVPCDAALWPEIRDHELRTLLPLQRYVFHPAIGLIGFTESEVLATQQLLERPAVGADDWGLAQSGTAARLRIVDVRPLRPPDAASAVMQGRDDMGSLPLDELPPKPDESPVRDALGRAIRSPLSAIRNLMSGKKGQAAGPTSSGGGSMSGGGTRPSGDSPSGGGESFLQRMQRWLKEKSAGANPKLAGQRDKELDRLRHLLANNPDEGLRYALPFRDLPLRGNAPSGSTLTPRSVDFSLSSFSNHQIYSGDNWDMDAQRAQDLKALYRAAADRELRLGRHRRAAYVLAELLGDFSNAASALEQGRFYREAAVLYQTKLNSPKWAAECLRRGGLLQEAAQLFLSNKDFEAAGDLYARLGQPSDAQRCYRLLVAQVLAEGNALRAAKLMETKLASLEEAIALLKSSWPGNDPEGLALRELFELLGRHGRHSEAIGHIQRVVQDDFEARHAPTLCRVLAQVATSHVDRAVKDCAADQLCVAASKALSGAQEYSAEVLSAIVAARPDDRLISHDTRRYREVHRPTAVALRRSMSVDLFHKFTLPLSVVWEDAVAIPGGMVAVGAQDDVVVVVRASWKGTTRVQSLGKRPLGVASLRLHASDTSRVLLVPTTDDGIVLAGVFPSVRMEPDREFVRSTDIVAPDAIPARTFGLTQDESGVLWALHEDGHAGVAVSLIRSSDGRLQSTHPLAMTSVPHVLAARQNRLFAAHGPHLVGWDFASSWSLSETLRTNIARFVAAPTPSLMELAAIGEEGIWIVWHDKRVERIGSDVRNSLMTFVRGGNIVVASETNLRVYANRDSSLRMVYESVCPPAPLVALLPTDRMNEVAVVAQDGQVRVYRLPRLPFS